MGDAEAQVEELQSIEAIYPDLFHMTEVNKVSLRFEDKVRLDVLLPSDYPSKSPPKYTLSCPSLSTGQRTRLNSLLEEAYLSNVGEPVLYAWIEVITEYLRESESGDADVDEAESSSQESTVDSSSQSIPDDALHDNCPTILTGDIFTDRKSVFQAHIAPVSSKEEVIAVLAHLKSNNKIARATHNMYAYRLTTTKDGQDFQIEDCDDDGEHGASTKMLSILHSMKANGLIVIVTRWYGGVHLGPDRFRIINNMTREMVQSHPEVWFTG